ncbi:MAG: DNA-binding protein [Oscillatoriales cyanobacterium RU_3_3]|nr:DNA-binding protein [Microcoleus sp. SU_5_6]NJL67887.1 DNA-binding protein [Microcoleus sp. SM1_3_4]NJM61271.1 DNA-binding protein [Oscillatoriales cyanobacterium RU_3_3]NJR24508.1 DNA-binding protein [Richelia sp. CSU_2_1]
MTPDKVKVRLNFVVSSEINETLEELANKTGGTKTEVFRRAIALMEVIVDAKEQGKKVGITDKDRNLVTEIVGI